ncbi:MAG: non-heme iron oxygenase ferredoxin subunit [bacterium]|nr:non-heme iron oxygenase ferredoxin subunit [bacterium]
MVRIKVEELKKEGYKVVEIDGEEVLVVLIDDKVYAVSNICTHAFARLSEGSIGQELECPFHGAKFDVKTGEALTPPASEPLKVYKVNLVGDIFEITP